MARAWAVQGTWGIENLRLLELEEQALGPRDIRLRVEALSINYRDYLCAMGLYNPRWPLPYFLGSDAAGVVEEIGAEVAEFKIGERVASVFAPAWVDSEPSRASLKSTLGGPGPGVFAESLVLPAASFVAAPLGMSALEAAALTCAGLTAWTALFSEGRVRGGQDVLVLGTGGVSLFALQFARAIGARVFVSSKSEGKLARAKALGANFGVNYQNDETWTQKILEMSGGLGVDHIIEVGGAGTFNTSVSLLKPGGTLSLIGVLSSERNTPNLLPVLMKKIRVQGIMVGSRASHIAMNAFVEEYKIRSVIDRVYDFEALPEALDTLASGLHFGKIGITVG